MTNVIAQFQGENRFLSNFWVEPSGTTNEHRFQAEKTHDLMEKERILKALTPGDAKRWGRLVHLREDWDRVKDQAMLDTLRIKFSDPDLRAQLLATGDAELIEGNKWHDTYWGVDIFTGVGQNKLGITLMRLREELGGAGSAFVEENTVPVIVKKHDGGEMTGPLGTIISYPSTVMVSGGEYSDAGEPDYVVVVMEALGVNGDDRSEELAKRIASIVQEFTEDGK